MSRITACKLIVKLEATLVPETEHSDRLTYEFVVFHGAAFPKTPNVSLGHIGNRPRTGNAQPLISSAVIRNGFSEPSRSPHPPNLGTQRHESPESVAIHPLSWGIKNVFPLF